MDEREYSIVDRVQLDADMKSLADKLRAASGTDGKMQWPGGFSGAVDGIRDAAFAAGQQSEYDRFWDNYQKGKGSVQNYDFAFAGPAWKVKTFTPKYDIVTSGLNVAFQHHNRDADAYDFKAHLEQLGIRLDTSNCIYFSSAFAYARISTLGVIDLKSAVSTSAYNLDSAFRSQYLESIEKIISYAGNKWSSSTFNGASKLQHLTIEGVIGSNDFNVSWSPLTVESLLSILNALQDKTGDTSGTKWVVTIGTTNKAKLTAAQLAIATDKGWTVN